MISAAPDPAEREMPRGTGGGAVEIHYAGAHATVESLVKRSIIAEQRRYQPIARIVRFANRLIEIFHANDLKQRAENLDVAAIDIRNVDDPRRKHCSTIADLLHLKKRSGAAANHIRLRIEKS